MRIRVFRNLTKGCYSIQGRTEAGWRTVAHAEFVKVLNARFHVSLAGRERVLRTGRKTVHAWVEGTLVAWSGVERANMIDLHWIDRFQLRHTHDANARFIGGKRVRYNPRETYTFTQAEDGSSVYEAHTVALSPTGMHAEGVSA